MAVEARRLNLFVPQLLANREMMNFVETNGGTSCIYNNPTTQMGYGVVPLSATENTTLLPMYSSVNNANNNNNIAPTDSFIPNQVMKPAMHSVDSSVTFNNSKNHVLLPFAPSRKRSREDSVANNNHLLLSHCQQTSLIQNQKSSSPFSFLGDEISTQIQQQQLDIDRLICNHMERVKMEIEEKRKRQARTILEAIEQSVMKKLRAKEEEIEKMGKVNLALEERVKSLCVENQIWRDVAQTNEAAANALRTNLEQVLAKERLDYDAAAAVAEDVNSCCGSSGGGEAEEEEEVVRRGFAWEAQGKGNKRIKGCTLEEEGTRRMCRNCGEEESSVLLLPCRHLCLCTVCGSNLHACPICKSVKNASVHVNMSS